MPQYNSFTKFKTQIVTARTSFVTIAGLTTEVDINVMKANNKNLSLIDVVLATTISAILFGFVFQQVM